MNKTKLIVVNAQRMIEYKLFPVFVLDSGKVFDKQKISTFPFLYSQIGEIGQLDLPIVVFSDGMDDKLSVVVKNAKTIINGNECLYSLHKQIPRSMANDLVGYQTYKMMSVRANLFGKKELFQQSIPVGPFVITGELEQVSRGKMNAFTKLFNSKRVNQLTGDEMDLKSEQLLKGSYYFSEFQSKIEALNKKQIFPEAMCLGNLYFPVDGKNVIYRPIKNKEGEE